MKHALLPFVVFVIGCSPIPYKYVCYMPIFTTSEGLKVEDTFATWGYFSERCPKSIPKRFSITGSSASLHVLVDGQWFRLSATDNNGVSLTLRGEYVRGYSARIDQHKNNAIEVEALNSSNAVVEHFKVPFELLKCTCVSYDGL